VFQELKRYLTSPPIMITPEPGEHLLLYIVVTAEAVSMMLVAERPDPQSPHQLGSSSIDGSGSQDLGSLEELRTEEAAGSQLPEICPTHGDTRSQPPEAASGPNDQTVVGSRTLEVPSGPEDRELPVPAPMEVDAPDPPPPPRAPWLQLHPLVLGQLRSRHVPRCSSSSHLTLGSSGAATCPMTPAPASWLRAAPESPRVPWGLYGLCAIKVNKYPLATRLS
jgi:hypothetical protein